MGRKKRTNQLRVQEKRTATQQQSSQQADGTDQILTSGTAQAYSQIFQMEHEGPIPHPQILSGYDQLVPGSAKRIMDWAERDLEHNRTMETTLLQVVSTERRRGQYCAVAVCTLAFSAASYCAYVGATTAAAIIGGTTVVSLVIAFLGSRQAQKK
jgi:uncharacterized membrane protein